jgi:hypothetical protein
MEPRDALELRTRFPQTPYKADAWEQALRDANLFFSFIDIPSGFRNGFIIDFPPISYTQSPPNKDSFVTYIEEFNKILDRELLKERYIGPFSLPNLESAIGPFQSSPLSIIPKPGRPGKFRVVQNFSYPRSPSVQFPNPSINSFIQSEDFPTTWGKFSIVFLLISRLPPGSEAATRDVAEAYRTVPLHLSQWPAAVVRASEGDFYIDTCTAFGATPSAGIYGRVADAGAEILRSRGIGPLDKWVDDHIFFRIKSTHLSLYNDQRAAWARQISNSGGLKQSGSRLWYPISDTPGDSFEEFNENCTFPLRNLSHVSSRSEHDASFTYTISDIDNVSDQLGIPWERSKDQPFSGSTIYIGFKWDLDKRTVSLAPTKVGKYLDAIRDWSNKSAHVLKDVQTLYGKLLHASAAIPRGRAYLTSLERMMRLCADKPFMPHRAIKSVAADLRWWTERLQRGEVACPIKPPSFVSDPRAFSDASSGVGIAVVVGSYWRAWILTPGWQTLHGAQRDIGWAEAVGFELLVRTLDILPASNPSVLVHGDNTGVVEGWWNGRHRNTEANNVFRRIHEFLLTANHLREVHTRYIPSGDNPVDEPSRGIYPPRSLLLPDLTLPEVLRPLLSDVAANPSETIRALPSGASVAKINHRRNDGRRIIEAIARDRQRRDEEDQLVRQTLLLKL